MLPNKPFSEWNKLLYFYENQIVKILIIQVDDNSTGMQCVEL